MVMMKSTKNRAKTNPEITIPAKQRILGIKNLAMGRGCRCGQTGKKRSINVHVVEGMATRAVGFQRKSGLLCIAWPVASIVEDF
jgi:hypothetical protein